MKYNIKEVIDMKKLMIFMIFTLVIFAKGGTNGNSSSGGENKGKSEATEKISEKKDNENTRDDVAKYNWGQEKGEYSSIEERNLDKDSIKHYGNLMKIMYNYEYRITTEADYKFFLELYENDQLKIDGITMKRLMLEFQRYNGQITEEEYEEKIENGISE